jgi:hypothetical protein
LYDVGWWDYEGKNEVFDTWSRHYPGNFLERLRKITKTSVRIAGVLDEGRSE